MKDALTTTKFRKQYKKLPQKIQDELKTRVKLFQENPRNPSLRIHKLKGEYRPLSSMNITGDYRVLFLKKGDIITFHAIGTHSQLY